MNQEPPLPPTSDRSWLSRLLGDRAEGLLVRGSLLTFFLQGMAAALGLGLHVALTWMLQSESQYGLYLLAMSTVMIAAVPVTAGWDTVLMRYLAQYREPTPTDPLAVDESAQERQTRASRQVTSAAAAATSSRSLLWLGLSTLLGLLLLQTGLVPEGWTRTITACVIVSVPFMAWSSVRQGALRGRHRGAVSTIPESILRPTITVLGVAVAWMLGIKLNADIVMLSAVLAGACAMFAGSLLLPAWLRRELVPRLEVAASERAARNDQQEWRHLAGASVLAGLAIVLLQRVDEWLLGWLVSPAEAGVYGPASRFAGLVVFGLNAVSPILAPMLAAYRHDRAAIERLAKRGARLNALIATPLVILLVAYPQLVLVTLPETYAVGASALRILALAQWFNAMCGSVGTLLSMTGHHRDLARILLFTAALDILLNLTLIPIWGALGAAVATATSIVTWNCLAWLVVRIRLGIDASAL